MALWEIESIEQIFDTISILAPEPPKTTFTINYYGPRIIECVDDMTTAVEALNLYSGYCASHINNPVDIEKVIFNDPATIIIWTTGEKTVVKCGEGEVYDPEKGFAMAIAKYVLGNKGNYYETFKKWLPKEEKTETFYFCPDPGRSISDAILKFKELACAVPKHSLVNFMNPPESVMTERDAKIKAASVLLENGFCNKDIIKLLDIDVATIRSIEGGKNDK